MRKTSFLFRALSLIAFCAPLVAPHGGALAADCDPTTSTKPCLANPPSTCSKLGEATMDVDRANIIVCLQKDSNTTTPYYWRSMSPLSSGPIHPGWPNAIVCHTNMTTSGGSTGNVFYLDQWDLKEDNQWGPKGGVIYRSIVDNVGIDDVVFNKDGSFWGVAGNVTECSESISELVAESKTF